MPLTDESSAGIVRRLPVGAEVQPHAKGVHFRVWAPEHKRIEVIIEGNEPEDLRQGDSRPEPKIFSLEPEAHGYFSGMVESEDGSLYHYDWRARALSRSCITLPASGP
jgi:maltooligosyltrehalose trehalohydrolase